MAPRRLVAPFLALVLGIPVFLATPTPAAAACYWSSPNTVQTSRVVNGSATATWTGTVTYQIGYTCSGQRSEVLIDTFTQKMKFTGAIHPKVWHADSLAGVLSWFNHFGSGGHSFAWTTGTDFGCFANCTVTRVVTTNVLIPYNSTGGTYGFWTGCDGGGVSNCKIVYQFLKGTVIIWNSAA